MAIMTMLLGLTDTFFLTEADLKPALNPDTNAIFLILVVIELQTRSVSYENAFQIFLMIKKRKRETRRLNEHASSRHYIMRTPSEGYMCIW
mmetsp:Transcript_17011/g.29749  ORF Transcript_17011/g.29749 Transcript_17011/m.29749 type:complete len:91 (-) Transcript_17011:816-1088(-)